MTKVVQHPVEKSMLKTEEQIVLAAMKIFSQFPLDTATLRMIANEAGITLSLITYHFKTKEKLYQEIIHRALTYVTRDLQESWEMLENVEFLSHGEAKKILCDVIHSFTEKIYGNPNVNYFGQIIMREHFYPTAIYSELYEQYFEKVITIFTKLVGVLTGNTNPRENALQAFSIIGQVMSVPMERSLMIRYLGMRGFSEEEVLELKELIFRNIFTQLGIRDVPPEF